MHTIAGVCRSTASQERRSSPCTGRGPQIDVVAGSIPGKGAAGSAGCEVLGGFFSKSSLLLFAPPCMDDRD